MKASASPFLSLSSSSSLSLVRTTTQFLRLLSSCLPLFLLVLAERDPNYYGFDNPNLAYSHYWVDAANVLEDLSSFRALYVMYHNCAWSAAYYNYNSNNNNNKNNNHQRDRELNDANDGEEGHEHEQQQQQQRDRDLKDDKNNGRQCGGQQGGGGENNWYMGMGECVGTNVAYSLYGILPSDRFLNNKNPCMKRTFINSFYTTDGLRSFAAASDGMIDITYINQACTSLGNGYSTTLGCSENGEFQVDDFYGYDCNGLFYNSTLDTLDWLNTNMTYDMHCHLIYKNEGNGIVSLDYATQLLTYSQACNMEATNRNFCPDPFGLIRAYDYNFAMAQQFSNYTVQLVSPHDANIKARVAFTVIFFLAGVFLTTISIMEWWRQHRDYILSCQCFKQPCGSGDNKNNSDDNKASHEQGLLHSDQGVYA